MSYHQKSSYRPSGDLYRPNNRSNDNYNSRPVDSYNGQRSQRPDLPNQDNQYNGYNSRPNHGYNKAGPGLRLNGPRNGPGNFRGQNQGSSYNSSLPDHGPGGYRKHNTYNTSYNSNYNHAGNHLSFQSNHPLSQQSNYQSAHQPSHGNSRYERKPFTNHLVYSQTHSENQVWMGDLDPTWTEADISNIWVQVGETPVNIKLLKDKMGKPLCCFVKFSNSTSAANALKFNKSPIPGTAKIFKLNLPSGSSQAYDNSHASNPAAFKNSPDFSIFVGDLPMDISEAALFDKFNSVYPGLVKQAKVMIDPNSGASKGFGFVRFTNADTQQRALKEMNGVTVNLRPIRVGQANGANPELSTKKPGDPIKSSVKLAQHQPTLSPFTDPNNTVICIKNLTFGITRNELIAHFLAFGHIVYCNVNYTENVAHIKFLLRGAAERAILYMHGIPINGNRVVLRWGREESVTDAKIRFRPVGKNHKYVAAEKLPPIYGNLPTNVVFEDLSFEQVKALNFSTGDMTVESLNEVQQEQIKARAEFLDSLF